MKATGMHVNVSGAGVTARAKHRANAIKRSEFLSRPEAQPLLAHSNIAYAANLQTPVHQIFAKWGPCKQDDINVAAAGALPAVAIQLAERAGYK